MESLLSISCGQAHNINNNNNNNNNNKEIKFIIK